MVEEASDIRQKLALLKEVIRGYGDMVLAFSGGKDSTLLIFIGSQVLKRDKLVAVTAVSPVKRDEERVLAESLCLRLGITHRVVYTNEYRNPEFIKHPERRCLICKEELFKNLREISLEVKLKNIADGTSCDDIQKERAIDSVSRRYGIKWPLVEAGIGTSDVMALLKQAGLEDYIRPHYTSCKPWEILF